MDVSIIFVNYKTKDLTINAIKSVYEKTQGIDFEIFVVDNNSQDGSIEAIEQEFPNINIIKNPINAGFGTANNLAIKKANGKYILCLNTDTLLINNAIKIMFDFMENKKNKNTAVIGGGLFSVTNEPINSCGHFQSLNNIFWRLGLKYIFKNYYYKNISCAQTVDNFDEDVADVEQIIGADIFFRKTVLDEVGLFDENFFMYLEETDLCKRIKDSGYDIKLIKEAKIIHLEGKSSKNTLENIKNGIKSEFYFYRKHHSNQILLIKILYAILYLTNWIILRKENRKEMLIEVLKN